MNINIDYDNNEEQVESNNSFIKKFLICLFIIIFVISLIIIYARYKATRDLKVNEYKITNSLVPDNFHGIKIVHFSDIHFGNTVDIKYLKEIVNEINSLDGDIIVFTGDLLDQEIDINTKNEIINVLGSINANIGKYAISGESDYNISLFNEIINNSGFININNDYKFIYYKNETPIIISNKDDNYDSNIFKILLIHKPDNFNNLNNNFNIVFAGHSHNGQINIPFIKKLLLPDGSKKYFDHYYKINDTDFFISSGIGTNDFKFRFFNKPSINLYRLTKY